MNEKCCAVLVARSDGTERVAVQYPTGFAYFFNYKAAVKFKNGLAAHIDYKLRVAKVQVTTKLITKGGA